MPPEPPVTVVADPDDDPRLYQDLDARHDLGTGVVVVRPVPGVADTTRLATDILTAMGKHYDAVSRERQVQHAWDLAQLWTRAEHARHLVVCDAERLPPQLWQRLTHLATGNSSRLWLVARTPPSEAQNRATNDSASCSAADLLKELPVRDCKQAACTRDVPSLLPEENFLTFRSTCRRRLSEKRFAEVDAIYLDAYRKTRDWLRDEYPDWRHRPDHNAVAQHLCTVTADSQSTAETTVRLRATQAAFFVDGALLEIVDVRTPRQVDVPSVGVNRQLSARLRRLVTPAWTCALVASAAGGLTVNDLGRLNLHHVTGDGKQITIDDRCLDIPSHAAALIRAQLIARRQAGAADYDPLLITGNGARYQRAVLARRLETARHLAAVWAPYDQRSPPWQQPPPAGHLVRLVALTPRWQAVADQ